MSGLSGLFSMSSGAGDSLDALKYTAPKDPKKNKKPVVSTLSDDNDFKLPPPKISAPSASNVTPFSASNDPKPAAPTTKVLASSAVRLYRVNPSTQAYESVEGGNVLGCVVLGAGISFQILVYNAEKRPQMSVALSPSFDYTVRDLYMSFSDATGTSWSLLFDGQDASGSMNNVLRAICAALVHQLTHSHDADPSITSTKRSLPSASASDDAVSLSLGSTVGLYISIFEVGNLEDSPADMLQREPLFAVQAPQEVAKCKLNGSNDYLPGLSAALVGLRKGDKICLGLSPSLFYQSLSAAVCWVDAAKRKCPSHWLLAEVEIVRTKAPEKEKEKEQKKETSREKVQEKEKEKEKARDSDANPPSDIATRMSKLASKQSGQLASVLNPAKPERSDKSAAPSSAKKKSSSRRAAPESEDEEDDDLDQGGALVLVSVPDDEHQSASNAKSKRAFRVQREQERAHHASANAQFSQQSAPSQTSGAANDAQWSSFVTGQQQSMLVLQQSMMQLHNKLDSLGMQVQQGQTMVMSSMGGAMQSGNMMNNMNVSGGMMGNGMMGGAGAMGNAGMMNNGMMNPMGMPGMMGNMGNGFVNGMGMAGNNGMFFNNGGGFNPQLTQQLQQQVQQLQQQLQQSTTQNESTQRLLTQQEDAVKSLKTQLSAAEDRSVSAQVRVDSLQQENTELKRNLNFVQKELELKLQDIRRLESEFQSHMESAEFQLDSLAKQREDQLTILREDNSSLSDQLLIEKNKYKEALALVSAATREKETALVELEKLSAELSAKTIQTDKSSQLEDEIVKVYQEKAHLFDTLQSVRQELLKEQENSFQARQDLELFKSTSESEKESLRLELQRKANEEDDNKSRFSADDLAGIIQEIYGQSKGTFLTAEELETIDDEAQKQTMMKVAKLCLQRLREVLKNVSTEKL